MNPSIPAAWRKHAEALADWLLVRVFVRRDVFGAYTDDGGQYTAHEPVTRELLVRHCRGERTVGAHTTSPDNRCLCLSLDYDVHDDQGNPEANWRHASAMVTRARELGLIALVCDSNGAGGYHVRIFFKKPIPAAVAHWLGTRLVADWAEHGLKKPPEVFPKQPGVSIDQPFGNWLRAPAKHHRRGHWTRIYDPEGGRWLDGEPAVRRLLDVAGDDPSKVLAFYRAEEAARAEAAGATGGRPASKPQRRRDGRPDEATVRAAVAALPEDWADVYGGERGNTAWLGTGMALHDWDPARGLPIWKEFSARCPSKCDPAVCDEKWATFTQGGGLTVGTIFKEAERCGWQPPWARNGRAHAGRNGHAGPRPRDKGRDDGRTLGVATTLTDEPRRFHLTDLGNAERLVARHGADLRFCHPWGRWLVWDGRRWALDVTGAARRRAKETVRQIFAEAAEEEHPDRREAIVKHAFASEKRDRIAALLALAESEEDVPILPDDMDRDGWAFNCRNGTLDLRTGELRPHRREDLITKICPHHYDPAADCPAWTATLKLFFAGNAGLIDYWQRVCGCAMAGVVRDHILPVAYGTGSNGKSTILGALLEVFGLDYAMKAPPDMFMAKKTDSHPTDRADLFGKRLVVAIETEAGRRLNEVMVKELTGGDRVRARRMREDFWEFSPTHTLIMGTNHKPGVRGTDNGIWRRMRLIPFAVSIGDDEADKSMPEKLRRESPGILAWCVRGCLAWQARGLDAPKEVTAATADYRKQQDLIGAFLDECTARGPNYRVKSGDLYQRYCNWAKDGNERVVSLTVFGLAIQERGFERKASNGVWYLGLGLCGNAAVPERETGEL
jgi:P4 family phage/plasmid primase-like protien